MDNLRSRGFLIPEVMKASDGKGWIVWKDRLVEIHRFVSHDVGVHRDWKRMNSAATALADMHRFLAESESLRATVAPEMKNDISPEQCWSLFGDAAEAIVALPDIPELVLEEALEILQRAEDAVEPLIADHERLIGELPWLTVHGDFHFWNVLYRGDEIAAVIDYDFIQRRERLFDLAYAMQNVIVYLRKTNPPGMIADEFGHYPWKAVRLWLDHYDSCSHLPLTQAERKELPIEILRIYLVNLSTAFLQDDPAGILLEQGQDLDLFLWVSEQMNLFD
jgi:Ser/Thr protein kinase RdoA (MazF antagonist)